MYVCVYLYMYICTHTHTHTHMMLQSIYVMLNKMLEKMQAGGKSNSSPANTNTITNSSPTCPTLVVLPVLKGLIVIVV